MTLSRPNVDRCGRVRCALPVAAGIRTLCPRPPRGARMGCETRRECFATPTVGATLLQKSRRLTKVTMTSVPRPAQAQAMLRAGDADVEQATLLVDGLRALRVTDRQQALRPADDAHLLPPLAPLQALRAVQSGQCDSLHRRLVVGLSATAQLVGELAQCRRGRDVIDEFYDGVEFLPLRTHCTGPLRGLRCPPRAPHGVTDELKKRRTVRRGPRGCTEHINRPAHNGLIKKTGTALHSCPNLCLIESLHDNRGLRIHS